jgi:hypothetical protein
MQPIGAVVCNEVGTPIFRKCGFKPHRLVRCLPQNVSCLAKKMKHTTGDILPEDKDGMVILPKGLVALGVIRWPKLLSDVDVRCYYAMLNGHHYHAFSVAMDEEPAPLQPLNVAVGITRHGKPYPNTFGSLCMDPDTQTPEELASEFYSIWTECQDRLNLRMRYSYDH